MQSAHTKPLTCKCKNTHTHMYWHVCTNTDQSTLAHALAHKHSCGDIHVRNRVPAVGTQRYTHTHMHTHNTHMDPVPFTATLTRQDDTTDRPRRKVDCHDMLPSVRARMHPHASILSVLQAYPLLHIHMHVHKHCHDVMCMHTT